MPQVAPMQFFDHQRQPRVVGCRKSSRNGCIAKAGYNDFRPAWGVDAELAFVATGDEPSAEPWWLTILDDSGQAGALGCHNPHPTDCRSEKIFAGTDLKCGSNWTVTAGHELLEMLADPNINLTVTCRRATRLLEGCTPTKSAMPVKTTASGTRLAM
jgi:hypothetical protein